ncbi:MAG: hypothetical protein K5855_09785 [Oscillospiraceae bacterium]|nr:hypothetical protein [Oscillospiraceae bacterium]
MKKITVSDQTLRLNPSLSFRDKLEIARELDTARVDVIETPQIEDVKADSLLVRTLASSISDSVLSVPVGLSVREAEIAWEAVKGAAKPRLCVCAPLSPATMEYIGGVKPAKMPELVTAVVSRCAELCPDVEFSALDATRAESGFLREIIGRAASAGASSVSVCDSAGIMLPDEFAAFISSLDVGVPVSAECSDELGLGAACAFAALGAGAAGVKTAAGTSLPSLDTVAAVFRTRGDRLGYDCALDMTVLNRSVRNIRTLLSPAKSMLPSASPRSAAEADAAEDEDTPVPSTYKLKSYVINIITGVSADGKDSNDAMASVVIEQDGEDRRGLSGGNGPIDAAFSAIDQIIGRHYELDDFRIKSVDEGREAAGSALVKLRERGSLYTGTGRSSDIVGAGIRAYLAALNKIAWEERSK